MTAANEQRPVCTRDAVHFLRQEQRVIERVLDAVERELALRGVDPTFLEGTDHA